MAKIYDYGDNLGNADYRRATDRLATVRRKDGSYCGVCLGHSCCCFHRMEDRLAPLARRVKPPGARYIFESNDGRRSEL